MGYAFILNALAIEFDTWWNHSDLTAAPQVADPNDNHIGIHTHIVSDDTGLEANAIVSVTPAINMSDGNVHTARIVYNPPTMKIFLDNMNTPVLTASVDLGALLALDAGRAYIGLTAGTAAAYENHDILSWSFEESLFFGDVEALVNSGALNSGQGQSLTAKLEAALASLQAGNRNAVCGQLQAYINQVKAFVKAGILTSQEGQQLSDHASQVRKANGC